MKIEGKYPPAPIKGWMPKGPDYSQTWRGWKIYAEDETGDMVPVKVVADLARAQAQETPDE